MKKIYKDGEVLEAADLNASLAELEEKIKALTLQEIPLPALTDGLTPGNAGFRAYRIDRLIIFQGTLVVNRSLSDNAIFRNNLPEELCPATEQWFPSNRYTSARNIILYPQGLMIVKASGGDTTLNPGWLEFGAVKYVVPPATPTASTRSASQPAATQSTNPPLEES